MLQLKIVDEGIIFINSNPAYRHVSAFHPSIVQISDTEFICLTHTGQGLYATDSNVILQRSTDGGKTWEEEGFVYDGSKDDKPWSYHGTFVSKMRDGTIAFCPFRADRTDPEQPFFNDSGGLIDIDPCLLLSRDAGRTWSDPIVMDLPESKQMTASQSIVELSDGRWWAPFDLWGTFADEQPYKPCMVGFTSDDQGKSWSDRVVIADGAAEGKGYWHGRPICLSDGSLYSLFWAADMTQPEKGPVNLNNHFATADANGQNWTTPQPTQIPGQTHGVTELPDGRLAAVYTWRETTQPGFMVVLSSDRGRTWDLENQVRVWDATGWTEIGLSHPDKYPRSHDTIAFGAPSVITLMNGELLAYWWCTLASQVHTRWARLKLG
jgi:hypothetical protein